MYCLKFFTHYWDAKLPFSFHLFKFIATVTQVVMGYESYSYFNGFISNLLAEIYHNS